MTLSERRTRKYKKADKLRPAYERHERGERNCKVEGEYNHAISEAARLEAAIKEAKGEK